MSTSRYSLFSGEYDTPLSYRQLIDGVIDEVMPDVIRIRRQIHAWPELGFEEHKTSNLCAETLRELGVDIVQSVAGTGVVGTLRGHDSSFTVALRADMDALPISEETGLEFSSRVPGLMHACGHDGHVAILLGAAMVLTRLRQMIQGNIKFIFQPGEESLGGAKHMIDLGVLEDPDVDAIFALHLWPSVPLGDIAVHIGPAMAALDKLRVTLNGCGGHAATPHESVDTIVAASLLVLAMQTIVSREVDPLESLIVSIGQFKAGSAYNAIADIAQLDGTVRTLSDSIRNQVPRLIERKIIGVTQSTGTEYSFEYTFGYPPVINDPAVSDFALRACRAILGDERVYVADKPSMVGEDFAYYLERTPGAIFLVGTGSKTTEEMDDDECQSYPLHHPRFGFDERALTVGVRAMTYIALRALESYSNDSHIRHAQK
jgi:amidohydrolase